MISLMSGLARRHMTKSYPHRVRRFRPPCSVLCLILHASLFQVSDILVFLAGACACIGLSFFGHTYVLLKIRKLDCPLPVRCRFECFKVVCILLPSWLCRVRMPLSEIVLTDHEPENLAVIGIG